MRRSFGKLSQPAIGHTSRQTFISSSSSSSSSFDFSTSAGNGGGGGGRGRGRGSDFPKLNFIDSVASKNDSSGPGDETSFSSPLGRGHGKPLQSTQDAPPFSSFVASSPSKGAVAGRGRGTVESSQFEEHSKPRTHVPMPPQSEENSRSRAPIFFRKDEQANLSQNASSQDQFNNQGKSNLPSSILSMLSGAGRGKPTQASSFVASEKVEEVNRHIKARKPVQPLPTSPKLSQEEAVNKARSILSRGRDGGMEDGGSETQGGSRGVVGRRGGRGRGQRGGWSGRGRGRGRGMQYRDDDDNEDDEEETEADKANLEKLAKILGPEKMGVLVEAFEEASAKVLPSLETDAHVDAMHTNLLLECEPEYLMAEFDSNPDIDEKPPIPLQDALEKMKPFLMSYENIQTNKEWQKVVEETMKNVPLMKELVDYYSGPDRVTAKKQQEELERVAKTLPANTPSSLKRFTDRAVLSLQSNPGWGFDKKCQFMDKLVREVSQNHK